MPRHTVWFVARYHAGQGVRAVADSRCYDYALVLQPLVSLQLSLLRLALSLNLTPQSSLPRRVL